MTRNVVHHRTLLALMAIGPLAVALEGCTDSSPLPATPREAADAKGRLFGAALNSAYVNEPVYSQVAGAEFEMHVDASNAPTGAEMAAALRRFTDLGLMVNFSELDVRLGSLVDDDQTTKLDKQQRRYHDLVAACVQNPLCVSITTWGVTDATSWLDRDQSMWSWAGQGPHQPLLVNADGSRKPAYAGVFQALLGQ